MQLTIETNIPARIRNLNRLVTTNMAYAARDSQNAGAEYARQRLITRWHRDMTVRNSSFPRNTWSLRSITRAVAGTGGLRRMASVANRFGDDILRNQTEGGVRRPEKSEALRIPVDRRNWGRGRLRRRATDYVSADGRRIWRRNRRSRSAQVIAVLSPRARIPRRYRVDIVVANTNRAMNRIGEFITQREIDNWDSRLR